ncbi:Uncharacterized protein FKW44_022757, partial [Caligus rogercresseyi]
LIQKLLGNECLEKRIPNGMCAVLMGEACSHWVYGARILHRNDAEAVVVKPGCILTGYDHASSDEGKRGERAVFNAQNFGGPGNYWKNLNDDSLDDEISAVTCECPGPSSQGSGAGKVDPSSNARPGACPPVAATACAVLYDDRDCTNDDFDGLVLSSGEERSFSLLRSPLNLKYKNEIESVAIRSGCTLEAYDDSNFSDDGVRLTAKNGDLQVNFKNHPNRKVDDLESDIESVRCNC